MGYSQSGRRIIKARRQGYAAPSSAASNSAAPSGVIAPANGYLNQRSAANQASQIPATARANQPGQYRQVQDQQPVTVPAAQAPLQPRPRFQGWRAWSRSPANIRWLRRFAGPRWRVTEIEKIQDYSCTLVKRERLDGTLGEHEYMFTKIRQRPFSVYMYFLAPAKLKGQEVLYVAGQNDGNLLGHPNGIRHKLIGTVRLKPDSMLAMAGNRYAITELGLKRLVTRLVEVGEHDMKFGDCEVKMIPGAKVSGRDCTCIQVVHTARRKEFIFNMARIFVDNELNVPIRYEAYEWPKEPGGPPMLVEEYTYVNLKLNNGFTDQDFDPKNPNYQFQ